MIRTQIQLTGDQMQALRRLAAERGVSVAALAREGVERVLAQGAARGRKERALRAVGAFASGRADVSEEHDRELGEAFAR